MIRIETQYPISILSQLLSRDKYVFIDGYKIKSNSDRYKLFTKNHTCVNCGLEGSIVYLEKEKMMYGKLVESYHANLYGIKDGKEILFTKDHIQPVSKGGKNKLNNYQTLCFPCNQEKGNKILL